MKRLRRLWGRWFLSAWGVPAITETLLLGVALTALSAAIYDSTFPIYYSLTLVFFVNPLCALYYSLRLRRSRRRRLWQIFNEAGWLALTTMLTSTLGSALIFALNNLINLTVSSFEAIMLLVAVLMFPYFFFRIGIRLWLWWRRLCERHLIWSLMNSHLVALALVQVAVILPLMLLIMASNDMNWVGLSPSQEPFRNLFYRLNMMLPLLGVAILLSVMILAVLLPASAVVSYFFARRIKKRLDVLVNAAHAARDGDYQTRVLVTGQDEITALQTDFNAMITNLEAHVGALHDEREKVSALLKLRRELLANVSHELRTPVATLRGYLDSAQRRGSDSELAGLDGDDLVILQRETEALGTLIDDLFTLSRAETDHLSLTIEPTNLHGLVTRLVETAAPMAWRDKRIEVSAQVPAWLSPVQADAQRLEQALRNLIHNSLRHTLPGGLVVISAEQHGVSIEIAVRDTGEGIAEKDLPHVWERFYRDVHHGGTGLGLALVKSFVEGMGGRVSVESVAGEGACFKLSLLTSEPDEVGNHLPQPEAVVYKAKNLTPNPSL